MASADPADAGQFSRHLALIAPEGLARLRESRVTVVGAGGLGSTLLELLVRSGIGELVVYDAGVVDLPDLNRQLLYTHDDLGKPKAEAAAARLRRVAPSLRLRAVATRVEKGFRFPAPHGSTSHDRPEAVVDCLDNFETRFVVDDACAEAALPLIHGGVYHYFGQVTVLKPGVTPRLRQIFDESQTALDAEANKPMFPPAVVGVATVQATECIKLLLGKPDQELLCNRILSIDYSDYSFREIPLAK